MDCHRFSNRCKSKVSKCESPCECKQRAVKGLHAGMWHYLVGDVWLANGELERGDALVLDRLACHHDLTTRRLLYDHGVNQLPLPAKSAATKSPLDNSWFAVLKGQSVLAQADGRGIFREISVSIKVLGISIKVLEFIA